MCGITGFYNLNGKPVDKGLILLMTEKVKHRGPDDSGVYFGQNIALGQTRLSIIDLSKDGHQPMCDISENYWIVFNGEIYNFKEIRKELEFLGHNFKSKTDTEVILNSYKQWKEKCLDKFDGMFAFAIYDKVKKEIFVARDRMGEKPLYYYFDNEKFIFASEIKAILEDKEIKREINNQGLVNYFTFGHSVAPDTIYKGIKKLLPGHYIIFKTNKIEIKRYWDISFSSQKQDLGEKFYYENTKKILEESVKERLISDVPLGVFLSGGIDSSLVVSMMAKNNIKPLKTFSVGFDMPGKEFNELKDAKIVANYFGTEHHELLLKESDLINTLNKIVYHFDEPFGDAASFPVFCMSQFAKKYVSVVLTGEGGDEIFGGYRRYVMEKNKHKFLFLNHIFKNKFLNDSIGEIPGLRRFKKMVNAFSVKDDLLRYTKWISFFSPDVLDKLLKDEIKNDPLLSYRDQLSLFKNDNWTSAVMGLDQKILLPDGYLEKVDKMTMSFGLESRAPFLDHKIVEFANSIPVKYKINGFDTKSILRKIAREYLPNEICKKPKHGFAVPTNNWLRFGLEGYLKEVIFDQRTRQRGYFNYDYIEKIYKLYQGKNQPLDSQMWLLLNFELWYRQFIDN